MRRIPRTLATLLIFALLNVSYINLALAGSAPSSKPTSAPPVSKSTPVSPSVPDDDPCVPKVTKKCIENDLDQTQKDFDDFRGPAGSFTDKFFTDSGFDITEDITDAKGDLGNLTDTDVDNPTYTKLHKKFKKHHQNVAAILSNPSLMALLHRPSPVKFHVVVTSASGAVTSSDAKALSVSSTMPGMSRSFPSLKSAARRGGFAKGLMGLNVTVVPETEGTCSTGTGVPEGVSGVFIARAVAFLAEAVKEAIPDDTATVLPHGISVIAWAAAKGVELVLDNLHQIYMECKTVQDGDKVDSDLQSIKGSVSNISSINTTVNTISGKVTTINDNVTDVKTTVNNINPHTDTVKNDIITEIGKNGDKTTTAVNTSTTTVTTALNSSATTIINNDNTNTTNINNKIDLSKTTIINNDNTNATNIVNNSNSNTAILTTLSLRLMIEADLQQPDNSVPLALFETPTAKGGYLEMVRSIVVETYKNLTTLSTAQITAALAQGDSYANAKNYKAAYAAYKKAYKTAAN